MDAGLQGRFSASVTLGASGLGFGGFGGHNTLLVVDGFGHRGTLLMGRPRTGQEGIEWYVPRSSREAAGANLRAGESAGREDASATGIISGCPQKYNSVTPAIDPRFIGPGRKLIWDMTYQGQRVIVHVWENPEGLKLIVTAWVE
jgi:hypothetical protein